MIELAIKQINNKLLTRFIWLRSFFYNVVKFQIKLFASWNRFLLLISGLTIFIADFGAIEEFNLFITFSKYGLFYKN